MSETEAVETGAAETRPAWAEVEETFLGSERRYTRHEAAEQAGVPFPYAQRLWRALGLAETDDETVMFTERDVAALSRAARLISANLLDEELGVSLARAMGQTVGRLAEWQANTLVERLSSPGTPLAGEDRVAAVDVADQLVPEFEALLTHAWRRQLASSGLRAFAAAETGVAPTRVPLAVGFVDFVSFARLSATLDEDALLGLIDRFEIAAADAVAAVGGRIAKTMGDEVLFVANTAAAAVEGALRLTEGFVEGTPGGDVRVGVAYGEAVQRFGDVSGATVDLASRLTSRAEAGSVLIDDDAAAAVSEDASLTLTSVEQASARGASGVRHHIVQRA